MATSAVAVTVSESTNAGLRFGGTELDRMCPRTSLGFSVSYTALLSRDRDSLGRCCGLVGFPLGYPLPTVVGTRDTGGGETFGTKILDGVRECLFDCQRQSQTARKQNR